MANPVRLYDKQTNRYFIVDDKEQVYADLNGDGDITKRERVPEDSYLAPAAGDVRAAKKFFDTYFALPFPGAKTNDGRFVARGRLNDFEARLFEASDMLRGSRESPRLGVPANRTPLQVHLDFFDHHPSDGMITVRENYQGWRALGFGKLGAVIKTVLSSVVFGRVKDGFGIDVERIGQKRPSSKTGIYTEKGEIDYKILDEFVAEFDKQSKNGVLTHEQFMDLLARKAKSGTVSYGQFRSLLQVCERLNHGKTITRDQFVALFEGSLLYLAASVPGRDGVRGLDRLV